MKSIEFAYWLQGYFETCDVEFINRNQISTIQNHLEMVEILEGKEQLPFCFWLRGLLDGVETADLSLTQTKLIKERLNMLFEHVVSLQKQNENNPINRSRGMSLEVNESSQLIKC